LDVVKAIYKRTQILERFPFVGQAYHSPSGRELRILLCGHYRIVYLVREDGDVHVVSWCDEVAGIPSLEGACREKGGAAP
jgi:hypothetical protein